MDLGPDLLKFRNTLVLFKFIFKRVDKVAINQKRKSEGNGTPLQYSLPGKSHGRRSLVGCSPLGREESETTERLHFHALEKEMASHSSVLAWRIPGTGEPGGLPSMGSHRVRHDWSDLEVVADVDQASQVALVVKNLTANAGDIRDTGSIPGLERSPGEGNGYLLQYSCLEDRKSVV